MQAQTTGRLREYRFNRGILIALAGIGLLIASLVGVRALTDGQSVSQTPALSPVAAPVVEDPPLPAGWVDSYFTDRAAVIPVEQDPRRPDGFHRPTDSRSGDVQGAAGYAGTTAGLNTTTLNLDQNGADVFPAGAIGSVPAMDVTTLPLDREGADSGPGFSADSAFDNAGVDRSAAINALYSQHREGLLMTVAGIQFLEDNVWDYEPLAQPAGDAEAPTSAADYRFIEENTWGDSPALPPTGAFGQLSY